MSTVISVILCILLFEGCTKTDQEEIAPDVGNTKITLLTSAADQSLRIRDINIYLYNTTTSACIKHTYLTNQDTVEMHIPIGRYEIFVFANAGKDFGNNITISDIQQLKYQLQSISDEYLPMFGSASVLLTESISKSITLCNCTSRIIFRVRIKDDIQDMIIQKIALKNIPLTGYFNSPETKAETLSDIPYDMEYCRDFRDTIYIAENCAGVNSTITSQREKNPENAPENATYIQINALSGSNKFLTYYVFLGENNTTDFNIKRNSSHIMNITIEGEDKIDTRMEADTINVSDNILSHCPYSSIYAYPADNYILSFSKVNSSKSSKKYTTKIEFLEGDINYFTINGQKPPLDLDLGTLQSNLDYQIGYNPPLVSTANRTMCYRVTLRSSDGNVYQEDFSRLFANLLKIKYNKKHGTLDQIISEGDKYYTDDTVFILVPDNKVLLKAICEDGSSLDGWYRENGQIVSQNEEFTYDISSKYEILTMKFKKEKTYIYTNLDEVQITCLKKEPLIDSGKSAYIVDVSEYCEIRPKDLSRLVEYWVDENGDVVSYEPDYNFNAAENIHIYPKYK